MCSGEFKLAEEDLPFLCWAKDFLKSLYNQGGTKKGEPKRQGDRKGVYVCLSVYLSYSLSLSLSVSDS